MRNSCITLLATLLGLSLLGSARAESLKTKLTDVLAASTGDSTAKREQQAVSPPRTDDAERQALDAEARDATNRALENARSTQK